MYNKKILVNNFNMIKNKNAGFTLVEVLTVIMIIAILASVILVSLDSARERTREATIKNQMSQLRSLAESEFTFQNGYAGLSALTASDSADKRYHRVEEQITEMNGTLDIKFSDNNNHYCAYANLGKDDLYFCVDSLGDAIEVDRSEEDFNCYGATDGGSADEINCGTEEVIACIPSGEGTCSQDSDCCSDDCDGMTGICN